MTEALREIAVHPTAVVHPGAELGEGVEVGPHAVIESGAEIGPGCRILAHANIQGRTILGPDCVVGAGAVLGGEPQDGNYRGERTLVRIGAGCIFHEHTTVHRATGEGQETFLGDRVRLMTGAHVGHNCRVENDVVLVNGAALGGHAFVGERAFLSLGSGVHQFGKVGRLTLLGGATHMTRDAPPFSIVIGNYPPRWRAPNTIGLRRAGIESERRSAVRHALHAMFSAKESAHAVAERCLEHSEALVRELGHFVLDSQRGICAGPERRVR